MVSEQNKRIKHVTQVRLCLVSTGLNLGQRYKIAKKIKVKNMKCEKYNRNPNRCAANASGIIMLAFYLINNKNTIQTLNPSRGRVNPKPFEGMPAAPKI